MITENISFEPVPHPLQKRQVQWKSQVEGIVTEFFVTRFDNLTHVMITQLGKVGTIVRCVKENTVTASGEDIFQTDILLGSANDQLASIAGRQLLVALEPLTGATELILSLALKGYSPQKPPKSENITMLRALIQAVVTQLKPQVSD